MTWQLGRDPLTIPALMALAGPGAPRVTVAPGLMERLAAAHAKLFAHAEVGAPNYGFNTGFGANAVGALPADATFGLQDRLAAYLDCGTGPHLDEAASRAAVIARLNVLALGHSAVSPRTFGTLLALVNAGIAPLIARYGSLGASGDLVSMAPLARLVAGESVPCWRAGRVVDGPAALREAGVEASPLQGRDGLALMNGLSVAASLTARECHFAQGLLDWALGGIAATAVALGAFPSAFGPAVNAAPARRHAGQARIARRVAALMTGTQQRRMGADRAIQDEYSVRCVPQSLGPVIELWDVYAAWIEAELNGSSDNPVFHPDLPPQSGGNFYGGYVTVAADGLAQGLARLGDALERQTFLLVDGRHGLPPNLVAAPGPGRHGVKGVHQLASALAMEAQRLAVPAALFARSAESHNQDVVSNAMNAATCLAEARGVASRLVAAHALIAAQAFALAGHADAPGPLRPWYEAVRARVPLVEEDRPLRDDLASLVALVESPCPVASLESH